METIERWARHGDAVREAIELGDWVHLDTGGAAAAEHTGLSAITPNERGNPDISGAVYNFGYWRRGLTTASKDPSIFADTVHRLFS